MTQMSGLYTYFEGDWNSSTSRLCKPGLSFRNFPGRAKVLNESTLHIAKSHR
jgi:hypothetical protein